MESNTRTASASGTNSTMRSSSAQQRSALKSNTRIIHPIRKVIKNTTGPASMRCPVCTKRFPSSFIQAHASSCTTIKARNSRKKRKSANSLSSLLTPRHSPGLSVSEMPSERGAPGFHVFPGVFIKEQQSLLTAIEATAPAWVDYMFRKTKNYGPAYDLRRKRFLFGERAPKEIPLPLYATDVVLPRLKSLTTPLKQFKPNQLAVGLYKVPGKSHILPHNDCENGNIATGVVGICLAAACTMTLILRARYSGVGHDIKRDVYLPAGAVYIMSGDALRVWEHAIFPGKTEATRYSLTFRDVSPRVSESWLSPKTGRNERFKQSFLT